MHRLLFAGVLLLTFAIPANSRSTVGHYTLSAYTKIATYDDENGCVYHQLR
jgi:hypothetical protein